MEHVYVLEYSSTDGYYTDSFLIKPCFSSLEKAVIYVKENYKHAREIHNRTSNVVKSFDVKPHESYYADFQMVDIHEIEVTP